MSVLNYFCVVVYKGESVGSGLQINCFGLSTVKTFLFTKVSFVVIYVGGESDGEHPFLDPPGAAGAIV